MVGSSTTPEDPQLAFVVHNSVEPLDLLYHDCTGDTVRGCLLLFECCDICVNCLGMIDCFLLLGWTQFRTDHCCCPCCFVTHSVAEVPLTQSVPWFWPRRAVHWTKKCSICFVIGADCLLLEMELSHCLGDMGLGLKKAVANNNHAETGINVFDNVGHLHPLPGSHYFVL